MERSLSKNQKQLVLTVCILASFVAFLDGSVVNVALPSMARGFGGGLVLQQWVVDAYLITLGSLILIAGSLSDLFGRRRVMALGLIWFGIASLLCALAPTGGLMIAFRAVQGIAGALLVPSSLALIIEVFANEGEGKAIGTWTAWTGIAYVVGPLLGGFLIDISTWRLIFAINVLPIVVTLWLMGLLKHHEKKVSDVKVDIIGAALCAFGLGGSVFALIEQVHYGWRSPAVYGPLITGLMLLVIFIRYERRLERPMLPLSLFKTRNFTVGNLATVAIYGALSVASFLITVFIQQVGGYSALQAGMAMLPITILMFLLSARFGTLCGRYGPRLFMSVGPAVSAAGFLLLLTVNQHVQYWTQLFPGIVLFGLGLSVTVAPLTTAILNAIATEHAGIGSAVNNAVARIAGLIAIAALGVVTGPVLKLAGFHRGVVAMAGLLVIGALISAIGIQNDSDIDAPKHAHHPKIRPR